MHVFGRFHLRYVLFSHTRVVARAYAQGLRMRHTRSIRDLGKTQVFKHILPTAGSNRFAMSSF